MNAEGVSPGATDGGEFVEAKWDGHAWVMLEGVLCDLSIFQSGCATKTPSNLKLLSASSLVRAREYELAGRSAPLA